MDKFDPALLKSWREKYRWPLHESRRASEERIMYLENLVKNNIFESGPRRVKDVLLEIVDWKTGDRFQSVQKFRGNQEGDVTSCVTEVRKILGENPNDVSTCINIFRGLHGVAIAVASAFLRFLDPTEHKYGIIDKNVAIFLNNKGITNFSLRWDGYVLDIPKNVREYQRYHNWLQQKARELSNENTTYVDIYGKTQSLASVDVEMAIFACTTQHVW